MIDSNTESKVLVLDDDKKILKTIERICKSMDLVTLTTTSAEQAEEILEQERVKVILVDQRMPEVTGLDFLSNIKQRYPYIVRILFTGYEDGEVTKQAINSGEVFKFVKKPWDTEYLKKTLREAIHKYDKDHCFRQLLITIEQKNKELEMLYKKQRILTSTISHELRAPIANIKTSIDILLSGCPGDLTKEQKRFLKKAQKTTKRVITLANEVLDVSKIDIAEQGLKLKQEDINAIVRDVAIENKDNVEKKGIKLKVKEKQVFYPIVMDKDRIVQVLYNLISNAAKFTEQGTITITLDKSKQSKEALISIKDTGIGISKKDHKKIFDKFEQLEDPLKRKYGGNGLGLAISKTIVEKHGGNIWVESSRGKGSCFYFTLPLNAITVLRQSVKGS